MKHFIFVLALAAPLVACDATQMATDASAVDAASESSTVVVDGHDQINEQDQTHTNDQVGSGGN
ncbi:hypothetical protein [Celeribacter arenosi]|uniref:Lipoprotein n=1 Tax=Celeribacter arenosi TaxID=792649 RepID=A0ABP7JTP5_9RHOB